MTINEVLEDWCDVKASVNFSSILIGNGASMAVWPKFGYSSLFDVAATRTRPRRLAKRDINLFSKLETMNFERVLESLEVARIVNIALGLSKRGIAPCYRRIQAALAEAVKFVHIPWSAVDNAILLKIRNGLGEYPCIFTTNYDLLVYWAILSQGHGSGFKDLFWSATFDPGDVLVRDNSSEVLFLHGGLHLYTNEHGKSCKKRSEIGWNLLDQFDKSRTQLPLIVSEGTSNAKMDTIVRSPYLWFAYRRLMRIVGPVCIFGHSLGQSDAHIVKAISRPQVDTIAVSVRNTTAREVKRFKAHIHEQFPETKTIRFFDSVSHPLGAQDLLVS